MNRGRSRNACDCQLLGGTCPLRAVLSGYNKQRSLPGSLLPDGIHVLTHFSYERILWPANPEFMPPLDTNQGTVVCRLFEQDAPITVNNFIELAQGSREWDDPRTKKKSTAPLYHGTIFHRVIPDFMIQGGDPTGTGMGGPGYRFQDETKGSPHSFDKAGKLAMANSGPGTNGSQFFVTVAPTPWLTGNHTIFGEVIEGQDVVDKISKLPRGRQDKPNNDVVLNSVTIERV